jgi:hypothetical protein
MKFVSFPALETNPVTLAQDGAQKANESSVEFTNMQTVIPHSSPIAQCEKFPEFQMHESVQGSY